jgi:hypothetical protein
MFMPLEVDGHRERCGLTFGDRAVDEAVDEAGDVVVGEHLAVALRADELLRDHQ